MSSSEVRDQERLGDDTEWEDEAEVRDLDLDKDSELSELGEDEEDENDGEEKLEEDFDDYDDDQDDQGESGGENGVRYYHTGEEIPHDRIQLHAATVDALVHGQGIPNRVARIIAARMLTPAEKPGVIGWKKVAALASLSERQVLRIRHKPAYREAWSKVIGDHYTEHRWEVSQALLELGLEKRNVDTVRDLGRTMGILATPTAPGVTVNLQLSSSRGQSALEAEARREFLGDIEAEFTIERDPEGARAPAALIESHTPARKAPSKAPGVPPGRAGGDPNECFVPPPDPGKLLSSFMENF